MAVEIVPYETVHVPAAQAFNARLRAAGVAERFGMRTLLRETSVGAVRAPGSGVYEELYLVVDGEAVRGGYSLKYQDFIVNGAVRSIGFFQQALSEGTIDKRYALIGPRLVRHALARQPLIYGLGIGGYDQAVARLLKGARFRIVTVPFYFRVEHAARFLRQVVPLRSSRVRRLASDVAAATGLGALGIGLLQHYRAGLARDRKRVTATGVSSFGEWADSVWAASKGTFSLGAVRDRPVLAQLYDSGQTPFLKVVVEDAGVPCGWAVCLATQRSADKYFGDLKLGSIVDLLAVPGYETALIGAAVDRLRQEDVDLVVTNQAFGPLGRALRSRGFLNGPSNFLFAASPMLAEVLTPLDANLATFYLNRGDGDGPVNL
jgi:hypothetical protein